MVIYLLESFTHFSIVLPNQTSWELLIILFLLFNSSFLQSMPIWLLPCPASILKCLVPLAVPTQPNAMRTPLSSSYPPFEQLLELALHFLWHSFLLAVLTHQLSRLSPIGFLLQLAPIPPLKCWHFSGLNPGSSSPFILCLWSIALIHSFLPRHFFLSTIPSLVTQQISFKVCMSEMDLLTSAPNESLSHLFSLNKWCHYPPGGQSSILRVSTKFPFP